MAVQNNYNNYIKRQKQNSTGNFRDKIKNSLSGVPNNSKVYNTTNNPNTINTPKVSSLGTGNTPKTNTTQNNIPKPIVPPNTSQSKHYSMSENIMNPVQSQNTSQPVVEPQKATPVNPTLQTEQPLQAEQPADGVGLLPVDVINNTFEQTSQTISPDEMGAINELANSPQIQMRAYANGKTPQQMAQELIEMQKQQLQKDWEMKKQELELQKNQAQQSYDKSVIDAENAYNQTVDKLNENRYQQKEDLAVSGQRRGIQYSPQQLGLENVANINHNKNLAEASKSRNELLNNLQIELSKVMSNITLGLQNATNEYNSSVTNLMADYNKTLMDWAYNDEQVQSDREWQKQQTEADRAWQEQQTLKDQQFQKEMQELSQKWQAEQNALDRAQGRSGGYSGGYSGYSSRGYGGRRNWSSYSGYKGYASDGWGNYSSNDLDLTTKEGETAFGNTVKNYSTDLYNALDYGGLYDIKDKGMVYADEFDKYVDYAKKNGASKAMLDELEKTRSTALKHMYNKAYARDTNTEYKIGDTIYNTKATANRPVRDEYVKKVKSTKQKDRADFYSKVASTEKERKQATVNKNFFEKSGQGRTLEDLKKFNDKNKSKTSSKTNTTKNKVGLKTSTKLKNSTIDISKAKNINSSKSDAKVKKSASNVKKSVAKSISNAKSSKAKVQKTTNKKASQNTKAKTQSKLQKSFSNLKKNISNALNKNKKKKK